MENTERKEKYNLINETLNDYFLYISDTFLDKHIYDFFRLALTTEQIIDENDEMYKDDPQVYRIMNPEYDKLEEYLSYSETLQILREYLRERLPQYIGKFEECLNNGIINFVVDPSDEYAEDLKNHAYYSHELRKRHTNIVFEHNYNDPATIIHEFMHQLNSPELNDPTLTRKLLTETISIFFECDILKYMQEKGYNKTDIAKILHKRIENTYGLLSAVALDMAMLYNFKYLGNLSDKSLEEAKNLDIPIRKKNQEEYLESVDIFARRIERDNAAPQVLLSYLIGTVIGLAYMQKNDPRLVENFSKLNDMVNIEEADVCLKVIGVDINKKGSISDLLEQFKKSVIEIDATRAHKSSNLSRRK